MLYLTTISWCYGSKKILWIQSGLRLLGGEGPGVLNKIADLKVTFGVPNVPRGGGGGRRLRTKSKFYHCFSASHCHFCRRVSPSCRNSWGEAEVAFYQTWREMMLWHGREFVYFQSKLDHIFPEEIHKPVAKSLWQVAYLTKKSYSKVRGILFFKFCHILSRIWGK